MHIVITKFKYLLLGILLIIILLISLVYLFSQITRAESDVVLGSQSTASAGGTKNGSLSWSHSVTSSDQVLLVGLSINGNTFASAVTYGGQL